MHVRRAGREIEGRLGRERVRVPRGTHERSPIRIGPPRSTVAEEPADGAPLERAKTDAVDGGEGCLGGCERVEGRLRRGGREGECAHVESIEVARSVLPEEEALEVTLDSEEPLGLRQGPGPTKGRRDKTYKCTQM